jgi:FkbM family methyltransferase
MFRHAYREGLDFATLFFRVVTTRPWGDGMASPREMPLNFLLACRAFFVFENAHQYFRALLEKNPARALLKTRSGLDIVFRQNLYDARILRESFLERPYLAGGLMPAVILDIGGYIGDFAVFAAKHLGSRVIVYEPTEENLELLEENVLRNNLQNLIEFHSCALAAVEGSMGLWIQKSTAGEIHVSSTTYGTHYTAPVRRIVQSTTLPGILERHGLTSVDLLKIDIEGGEYDVFESAPDHVFAGIHNIVFEYHPIEGYEPRLKAIEDRLVSLGYRVHRHGSLVRARRPSPEKRRG